MKQHLLTLSLVSSLLLVSLPNFAHEHAAPKASSEKQAKTAVSFRKAVLQLVRSNMGPLGAMAKGQIPMDADTITKNADRIEYLANMMHDYFALDTTGYSVDTDAKSDIWKNHEDFTNKINDMVNAASNLKELVANNQEDDFRSGIGSLGATCKACHDDYKKD